MWKKLKTGICFYSLTWGSPNRIRNVQNSSACPPSPATEGVHNGSIHCLFCFLCALSRLRVHNHLHLLRRGKRNEEKTLCHLLHICNFPSVVPHWEQLGLNYYFPKERKNSLTDYYLRLVGRKRISRKNTDRPWVRKLSALMYCLWGGATCPPAHFRIRTALLFSKTTLLRIKLCLTHNYVSCCSLLTLFDLLYKN